MVDIDKKEKNKNEKQINKHINAKHKGESANHSKLLKKNLWKKAPLSIKTPKFSVAINSLSRLFSYSKTASKTIPMLQLYCTLYASVRSKSAPTDFNITKNVFNHYDNNDQK
jgi:hypothetical protein